MEFKFTTEYNQKTLTAMAKALRKTVRKKNSDRTRIFCLILAALSVYLTVRNMDASYSMNWSSILNWVVAAALVISVVFEDMINGYIAEKKRLPGNERAITTFDEENYVSQTPKSTTKWNYNRIKELVESQDYFVFILNEHNAQVFDKKHLTGGTVDEFRSFITTRTGKEMLVIK